MSFLYIKLVQFHLVLVSASCSWSHVLGSLITNTTERIHAHWCLKLGQKLRNLVIFLTALCAFHLWGVASIVLILVSVELLNLDIFEGVPLIPSCFSSKLSGAFFFNFSRFKDFVSLESSLIDQHLIFVWIVCFLKRQKIVQEQNPMDDENEQSLVRGPQPYHNAQKAPGLPQDNRVDK